MTSDAELLSELSGGAPYERLRQLRENYPVRAVALPDGSRMWLITRYDDAKAALADRRFSKQLARGSTSGYRGGGPLSHHMLSADPPDHTRLRRLVSAGFTARRIEHMEPRIAALSAELLDDLAVRLGDGSTIDLIDAYAFPLPIQVICELLGIPSDDRDTFRAWSNVVVTGSLNADPAHGALVYQTVTEMTTYISKLLDDKRRSPADDLLSALVNVRDEGDQLNEDELVSMVFLMLVAGHETTVNLIGNSMYLLLTHPDQAGRLRAEPNLVGGAIEEFLRYEPPVQTSTFRVAIEPVSYRDATIQPGEAVLISLLSANRDEATFPEPNALDITRDGAGHLAFGHGIHFCLGAALARLEGRIAIADLLARFPTLRMADTVDPLDWRPGLLIRGLNRLWVQTPTITAAPA